MVQDRIYNSNGKLVFHHSSFTNKEKAQKLLKRLQNEGYDTALKHDKSGYHVYSGNKKLGIFGA